MKAVLISVRPKWCWLITLLIKLLEIRKTRPKIEGPFKCYIYCTKSKQFFNCGGMRLSNDDLYRLPNGKIKYGCSVELMSYDDDEYNENNFLNGKVIGEFICDGIISHCEMANADIAEQQGCIKREELLKYSNGKELFGWHISDLKIYDNPKDLCEFPLYNARAYYDEELRLPMPTHEISRPPQSWCYVEDITPYEEHQEKGCAE